MEINETTVLDDRGFIQVSGDEAKEFLQNIVTNDIEKVSKSFTLFSSIFTPQGKYLYDFFIINAENGYLLECEKEAVSEIIKIFNFYKLRSKINLIDISEKYNSIILSLEKFKEINKNENLKGSTTTYNKETIFIDPRRHKKSVLKVLYFVISYNYLLYVETDTFFVLFQYGVGDILSLA